MKKALYFFLIAGFLFSLQAYEKKSLIERFTNASCGPCATINNAWYNTQTASLLASGTISQLISNGWWPGASDPMYLLNQSDNTARINYYGVNAVPWIVVNGTTITTSSAALTAAVNSGNSQFSPFKIEIEQRALSTNMIEFGIKVYRDPTDTVTSYSNLKLQVALSEKDVYFQSPPGSNGESHFSSVNRKMLPNSGGSTFTLPAPGEFTEVILQYTPTTAFNQSVNLDSIRVVAFIQNDANKFVYQSEMFLVTPNFVAAILPTTPDIISSSSTESEFTAVVKNVGMMQDSYTISCDFEGPTGWTGNYTTVNGTKPFDQTDVIQIAPGDSSIITIALNPNSIAGFGTVSVQFESVNNPGFIRSTDFRLVTEGGVDVLVIDASNEGYGDLIFNSLENVYDGTAGIISREALTQSVDLSGFGIIAWSAGIETPVLTTDEVSTLQSFLDQNGQLLINGQNIGADIFEASGQSQHAQSFYNNYLHASYVQDVGTSFLIQGYAGDPISDGLLFILGSVYDKSPDLIAPFDASAAPLFKFGNGPNVSSITAVTEDYRVVYLGFGIEQIGDAVVKDSLIARSIRWLTGGIVSDVNENNILPSVYSLDQNFPNPFNPSTVIRYQVPKSGEVTLKVYDILGKEVSTLINQNQDAGYYNVQFDASDLSSGVYFYTLTAGEFTSTKKMTLVK